MTTAPDADADAEREADAVLDEAHGLYRELNDTLPLWSVRRAASG